MVDGLVPMTHHGVGGAVTADEVRIDGFPGPVRTSHYVSFRLIGFTGSFVLEGALVGTPTDADWYPVRTYTTEDFGYADVSHPDSEKTMMHNFVSKTVWLRTRTLETASGRIDKIVARGHATDTPA